MRHALSPAQADRAASAAVRATPPAYGVLARLSESECEIRRSVALARHHVVVARQLVGSAVEPLDPDHVEDLLSRAIHVLDAMAGE